MFSRKDPIARLIGDTQLDIALTREILRLGRKELGNPNAEWPAVEQMLKRANTLELKRMRDDLNAQIDEHNARIDARNKAVQEQRQAQMADAGVKTKPIDERPAQHIRQGGGGFILDTELQDMEAQARYEQRRADEASAARLAARQAEIEEAS